MNTLQTKWGDPSGKCGVVSHCSTQVWGRAYVWRRSRDQQVQKKKTLFKLNSFYLIRTLERCLKESRCLDLESLCIISEEKVCFVYYKWFLAMPPFDSPWEYIVNNRYGQFASTCMWSAMREALQMRAVWQAWLHSLTSGGLMWHWRLFSWT